MSRASRPKQFLSISSSGESLIQATVRRALPLCGAEDVWVVTQEMYVPHIKKHLPVVNVVTEPVPRNTAASIGLAALHLKHSGEDPIMVVLPADHAVLDEAKLRETLSRAIEVARAESVLVTIGVPPMTPHTGYGYIQRGPSLRDKAFWVSRFFEKPNLERATKYVESGGFYWNSGMFVWRASVILSAIDHFLPSLAEGLRKIEKEIGSSNEQKVMKEVFETLEPVSIDFGILEHARNCVVVEADKVGWNDVGSWDQWAEHFSVDENKNLFHGDVVAIDSHNCVVHSQQRLTALLGVEDIVVIDTGDALLVCPRDRVQDVRKIVDELKKKGRSELT